MSSPATDKRENLSLCKYWPFLSRVFYYKVIGDIITDTRCLLCLLCGND